MTIALVETPAPNPISEQDDHRKNAEVKMVPRGAIAAGATCSPWPNVGSVPQTN
jgi:hypothetical protein